MSKTTYAVNEIGGTFETCEDWSEVLSLVGGWYAAQEWRDEQAEALDGVDLAVDTEGVDEGDLDELRSRIRETENRIAEALGVEAFAGHGNYYVSAGDEAGFSLSVHAYEDEDDEDEDDDDGE